MQVAIKKNNKAISTGDVEASIWGHLRNFLSLLPETMSDPVKEERRRRHLPTNEELKAEVAWVEEKIKEITTSPIVFCHNDLLVGNVVWNR